MVRSPAQQPERLGFLVCDTRQLKQVNPPLSSSSFFLLGVVALQIQGLSAEASFSSCVDIPNRLIHPSLKRYVPWLPSSPQPSVAGGFWEQGLFRANC